MILKNKETKYNFKINSFLKKKLFNKIDILIEDLLSKGNSLFALTVNFQEDLNKKNYTNKVDALVFTLKKTNSLSFLHLVFEKNENNKNHLHAVVAVRNVMDLNVNLKNNLINLLKLEFEPDVVVKTLKDFLNIKNWITNYLWKNVDFWEIPASFWFLKNQQEIYGDLLDIIDVELKFNSNFICETAAFEYKDPMLNDFNGCKIVNNRMQKEIILDLIFYYIMFNKFYIYRDFIFKKIDDKLISYKKIGDIKHILYENFQKNIVSFFIEKFPYHFKNFDFYDLIKRYLKTNEKIIEDIKDLVTNRIDPDFSLLEFNDGIYSIKYNKFIPKKALLPELNLSTIKYYNRTFKHLGEPKQWIKDVNKALEINEKPENNKIFTEVCCYIANIFHKNKAFFSKKKVLYIHGESNSRKSTLIAKPLIGFFGKENVGFLSDSKNFKFQHLIGKKIGVLDEFKYDPNLAQEYLKLFAGEVTITEQKYASDHKIIEELPIIIISNNLIEEKNKNLSEALFSRIFAVQFKKAMENNDNNEKVDTTKINTQIDDILKEEEPKIIKYCNQIFYKSKYKTKTRIETQRLLSTIIKDKKLK